MTGKEIRTLRLSFGEAQEKFARRIGVCWTTIQRWERDGSTPHPVFIEKLKELQMLAVR